MPKVTQHNIRGTRMKAQICLSPSPKAKGQPGHVVPWTFLSSTLSGLSLPTTSSQVPEARGKVDGRSALTSNLVDLMTGYLMNIHLMSYRLLQPSYLQTSLPGSQLKRHPG